MTTFTRPAPTPRVSRRLHRGVQLLATAGLSTGLLLAPTVSSSAAAQPLPDATATSTQTAKDDPTSVATRERTRIKAETPDSSTDDKSARETVDEDNVDSWWDKIMNWITGDDEDDERVRRGADAGVADDDNRNVEPSEDAIDTQDDVVRIETLGDSIIDNELGGARPALQELFAELGITIEWVGTSNESGPESLTSRATDAHWGASIADMLPKTAAWVEAVDPDVIMISAGGNDMMHDQGQGFADRWDEYLATICEAAPNTPIIAATNHQLDTKARAIENELISEQLNPVIEATSGKTLSDGCEVTVVDMAGVIADDQLLDDLHPNMDGYAAMADQWFPALRTALNGLESSNATDGTTD